MPYVFVMHMQSTLCMLYSSIKNEGTMTRKTPDNLNFLLTVWAGQTFCNIIMETLEIENSHFLSRNHMMVLIADSQPSFGQRGRKLKSIRDSTEGLAWLVRGRMWI